MWCCDAICSECQASEKIEASGDRDAVEKCPARHMAMCLCGGDCNLPDNVWQALSLSFSFALFPIAEIRLRLDSRPNYKQGNECPVNNLQSIYLSLFISISLSHSSAAASMIGKL